MSSFLRAVRDLRDARKEFKQSIADGTFGRSSWEDDAPASVPTAHELHSDYMSTNPYLRLVMPQYERERHEAPHDWDSDPLVTATPLPYHALSAADCQIRILTLLPARDSGGAGDESAPIRCTLETVSLLSPRLPEYTALSYTWGGGGSGGGPRTIAVNGHRVEAAPNLHAALRELRARGRVGRLWIDAVCINQADREERSQQVLSMRSIYARASRTVVWLGPESATSNLAMHLLGVLAEPGEPGMGQKAAYREAVRGRHGGDAGRYADAWLAFDDLFARDYWRRVWIVQEIAVSRDIDIVCGPETISWKKLEAVFWGEAKPALGAMFDPTAGVDFSRPPRRTADMFDFWAWRKAIAAGQPKPLLRAMLDCRHSQATDPRDHIYALLGITLDGSILVPVPNYALPITEVFTTLAQGMIEANQSIDLICLRSRTGVVKTPGLPSWVPDWANLSEADRPYIHELALKPGPKIHDPNIQLFNTLSEGGYRIMIKDGVLSCSGRLYDIVDGLSSTVGEDGEPVAGEGMGIIQPEQPTSCYPGVLATAEAIQHSLHLLLDWTREKEGRDCADLISSCWLEGGGGGLALLADEHPVLQRWLRDNRSFLVGSIELGRWLDMHHGGYKGLLNKVRTQSRSEAKQQLFRRRLDAWMAEVEAVLRSGMRLMTTARGRVGMAHPQARPGDHICLMEGMDTFVILRPYEGTPEEVRIRTSLEGEFKTQRYLFGMTAQTRFSGGYKVVGEGYVKTLGTKKKIEDYSACTFYTFFLH